MARTRKQASQAICHDRPAYAHGLCRPCYDSKRWTGKLPTTVSGEARRMAEEAAGTIPRADRKDFESSKYVRTENPQKLERDPHVQREIQKTLEKRGLDERSKEHFVNLMWRYAESEKAEDEKRQLQAMRILGKALVAEQVQVDQPETLPLAGLEAGLQKMGLGDDVISKVGPAPETDLEDDESARFDA